MQLIHCLGPLFPRLVVQQRATAKAKPFQSRVPPSASRLIPPCTSGLTGQHINVIAVAIFKNYGRIDTPLGPTAVADVVMNITGVNPTVFGTTGS